MTQSNANNLNVNQLGGASELQVVIRSMLANISTGELVEVTAVEATGVAPVGFVSVRPLVYKLDGDNNIVERGEIHNVPYVRIQGGRNAVIIDPEVGDIGFCGICSRDISLVKRIKAAAAPNMRKISAIADAIYIGGCLNGTPSQYIHFLENGINIKSTGDVNINGLVIKADGTLITKDGDTVDKHNHGGVETGGGSTLPLGG